MLQIAIRLPFGWYVGRETTARSSLGPRNMALRDVAYLPARLQCDLGVGQLCQHETVGRALDYRVRYLL